MSERVVIVGGGMSGLVASWAFQEHGQDPVILEPQPVLGGDFLAGGLKYIHKTASMMAMLDFHDVPYADYTINGAIYLKGKVEPYPAHIDTLDPEQSATIQADHYRKTRRMEIGSFGAKSMNDPGSGKSDRRALRCDPKELIDALAAVARVQKAGVRAIESKTSRIQLGDGTWMEYDKLVLTIPLWVIARMCDWFVPEGMALALNIIRVQPKRDPFAKWDYVYTPYTPGDAIHRISAAEGGWDCEVNGDWSKIEAKAMDDLAALFPAGFTIANIKTGLKGHLIELPEPVRWPENVAPLGRFAKWDPRATTDVTLDDAFRLATRWGWTKTA